MGLSICRALITGQQHQPAQAGAAMGCGTDVSCWLPGRTQTGDFVQKNREPNVSRLWTERGGDRQSPATLYSILCPCYSRALPQETPSDRQMD